MKILVIDSDKKHIEFFKNYLYQYDTYFSTNEEDTIKALTTFEYSAIFIGCFVQNEQNIIDAIKTINKQTKIFICSNDVFTGNKYFAALIPNGFYVVKKSILQ